MDKTFLATSFESGPTLKIRRIVSTKFSMRNGITLGGIFTVTIVINGGDTRGKGIGTGTGISTGES